MNSDINPFTVNVRKRNRLIFLLLYHLGIRSGELLNLKINDFDLVKKTVSITRRPNDKSDTRKNQPLVKTYGRTIPITNEIIDVITDYIFFDRDLNAKNKAHDFLLVIHGNSRNRGEPLTTHAYEKIISTIKSADESLKHLSGHMLRHSWNYAFSRSLANSGISYESEDKLRKYLMGWSKKSTMCEVYNKKYISEKEKECIKSLYEFRDKVIKGE
ncbi:site-specific integrase [Erwinia mallotivora]|uniref:site-specific integrase n=1 Tax=Erwinia mallotivora TaxID=69222 RepID=UPI0021C0A93E|nr:site-specific integrase [Erwinia mallotivora]